MQFSTKFTEFEEQSQPVQKPASILVFGNEKGGSGKSTAAMQTAIALLRMGYNVGTIDLDAHQGTLTRYMRNRFDFIANYKKIIPSPAHMAIHKSEASTLSDQKKEDSDFLLMAIAELERNNDFILVDTPGSNAFLSQFAHGYADVLITPMNDSFIDLDLIADIDPKTFAIRGASIYTQMVQNQMQIRTEREIYEVAPIRWIVMRNRLSHLSALNKRQIEVLLNRSSKQFGFEVTNGFGERVIFRELFLQGLTLMDLKENGKESLSMSHISARQEVRSLIQAINPEALRGGPQS